MEIKVIAMTSESINDDKSLFTLGGKMAGVCYMTEDYFDGKIQDINNANKRAKMTSLSGHHSVFEHGTLSIQLSRIPKIIAMILNSIEQYTTSEKSGRYTSMHPNTALELELYSKWDKIFNCLIGEAYPKIDDKTRRKLAIENARYMISVFTPTYMVWTVNYRQLSYVCSWLDKLASKSSQLDGDFNSKLAYWCAQVSGKLRNITTSHEYIQENKNREIEFMHYQTFGTRISNTEFMGDIYQLTYMESFAALAQQERHRTIHYEMEFSGNSALEFGCYIPEIIRGTKYESEWMQDFEKVSYCYPNCTLVKVLEQGRAVNFFNKCKERLCGRAQLEVMRDCYNTLEKFNNNKHNLSLEVQKQLENLINSDGQILPKCCMNGIKCTEGCLWGGKYAFSRQI